MKENKIKIIAAFVVLFASVLFSCTNHFQESLLQVVDVFKEPEAVVKQCVDTGFCRLSNISIDVNDDHQILNEIEVYFEVEDSVENSLWMELVATSVFYELSKWTYSKSFSIKKISVEFQFLSEMDPSRYILENEEDNNQPIKLPDNFLELDSSINVQLLKQLNKITPSKMDNMEYFLQSFINIKYKVKPKMQYSLWAYVRIGTEDPESDYFELMSEFLENYIQFYTHEDEFNKYSDHDILVLQKFYRQYKKLHNKFCDKESHIDESAYDN